MPPKTTNGDHPATQHDLSLLAGEMASRFEQVDQRFQQVNERFEQVDKRFQEIDERFQRVEERLTRLEEGQAAILNVVTSIDRQLKEWQHIPTKVDRLHKHIFPSQ